VNLLGAKIRELRRKLGWDQMTLAEKAKIDVGYLSRIENGRLIPRTDNLKKIAEALGTQAEELEKLAVRTPNDLSQVITQKEFVSDFMRRIEQLSPEQKKQIEKILKGRKSEL